MTEFDSALQELGGVFGRMAPEAVDALVDELAAAGRIVVAGAGRERLQGMGLAMRLYHLGLDAHVAGEMTCPPVGPGDLLLVTDGPAELAGIAALMRGARAAGARVLAVTAQPLGPDMGLTDRVVFVPAQTMADDLGAAKSSTLPMGSLFEGALFLLFEVVVLRLIALKAVPAEEMRARHTNLE